MLQIIKNALNTVRLDPDHGELMYQILYLTYFSERKLANREAILAELERIGFQMSMVTYHSYLNMAIKAIDRILWGYTARDLRTPLCKISSTGEIEQRFRLN